MLAVLFFLAVTLAFQNGILACLVDVCILGWFWPDHPTCICLSFCMLFMHNNDIAMDTDSDGDDYNCMDKKESCDDNF